MNKLKIIVLGSKGQLGSDLMKTLSNSDRIVIGSTSQDLNVLNDNVSESLQQYKDAGYIINCIATTNVDGCEDDPVTAFNLNSAFVVQLARFCALNQITLIHISTDYVFDGAKASPYVEDDIPNPLNVYGLSKYAGEIAVHNYTPQHFILRVSSLFGVAGASGKGGNFITTMLRLNAEKDSFTVIDDQVTCPTHTLDIARAIDALITKDVTEYGIYNCVSSSSCSWFEFAQAILRASGNNPDKVKPVSYNSYNFKARRPQYGVMSNDKLSKYYVMPGYEHALNEYLHLKKLSK